MRRKTCRRNVKYSRDMFRDFQVGPRRDMLTLGNHKGWILGRAALEGQAICRYLQRFHADEPDVQSLLLFPSMVCGAVG